MSRSKGTRDLRPPQVPPFRRSQPDRYRITATFVGYEIEIAFERNSALRTHLFAFTRRGANRKAVRYITRERARLRQDIARDEGPWTFFPDRADRSER